MTDIQTDDFLAHFGIKGMKWGVRHVPTASGRVGNQVSATPVLTKTFSTGDTISIYKDPPTFVAKFLSARSAKYKTKTEAYHSFTLKDKDGKKVGDASFNRESKDELNLVWIGIKPEHRGKGYASAAMQGALKYAEAEGIKKLTLEVPGNSPDARHIYTKMGFKDDPVRTKQLNDDGEEDFVWGGLTAMYLDVNKVKHADEDISAWERQFANEFADFLLENFHDLSWGDGMNQDTEELGHQENISDDTLAHFGVKGMKWGIRHNPERAAARTASRVAKATDRANRARQRETDRVAQERANARAEKNRDATILNARKNLPKSARELRIAKADYRVNKHTMGRKAAKEILNKYKNQHRANSWNASMQTGKERVVAAAEAHRQMQYREMMRQEMEAQRRREANAALIRELLNPTPAPRREPAPATSHGRHVERGQGRHAAR